MKRILCTFLCILLCYQLCACQNKEDTPTILVPEEFFYLNKDFSYDRTQTILGSELRESAGHETDFLYLLDLYLEGPVSSTLRSPFPRGCHMLICTVNDSAVTLVISDQLATLSGTDLTIANLCLAKTAANLTGCTTVTIQARTELLDGKKSITLQASDFLLLDDYIAPTSPE